ncbi:uncharacterized mitochondrial protein AtMg00820-like [Lathyrus oleraceus]|uniref:uncharacterized mitochondrial protein AtMg00820-like n=1 Tax=Pisum sativum TaxID=3888 RepID=UPI0021CFE705|nr:uncharacterized mitochondrial protein AtMg00820-like [Pisum sativum]
MAYNVEDNPINLQEVLLSLDADLWHEAINDEIDSLKSNKTMHLVDLSPGCKSVDCKWVLNMKLKPDRTIDKYKTQFLAKGFRKRENIDFFDTFSPITRIISIRTVNDVISLLCNNFDMKDLRETIVILGIKITRYDQGISLDQSHYVEKILKK